VEQEPIEKIPREFWVKNGKLNKVDQPKYRDEIGYNLQQPSWMGSAITANKGLGERDGLKVVEHYAYEALRQEIIELKAKMQDMVEASKLQTKHRLEQIEQLREKRDYYEEQFSLANDTIYKWIEWGEKIKEQNKILQNGLEAISIDDFSGTHNYHAEKTLAKAAAVVTVAEPEKKDTGRCSICGPYESCYCSWCHSSGQTCLACGEGYGDEYEK
jgi:hypothetical protein